MKNFSQIYALLLMFVFCTSGRGQSKMEIPTGNIKSENNEAFTYQGPKSITRNIIQDRNGNIWMASWEGVFKYDARPDSIGRKSFTNITSNVSSARFFSILEDSKGNLWFGSIGSGVYRYDGNSFQNFTIKDGLLNNDVVSIYEDKKGGIWFGVWGGASLYDGKSFRNYIINEDTMYEDRTGKTFPDRPSYEVNSIIEDQTGRLWFATRGNTFIYDARTNSIGRKSFTIFKNNDKTFRNVRHIIEDRKGSIWFGGNDGLWCYDGSTFNCITRNFGGFIYEDSNGNIWTNSETPDGWALSCYDKNTKIPKIIKANEGMIFGILEAYDGSIWFGTVNGVSRYDGKIITDFKSKEGQK